MNTTIKMILKKAQTIAILGASRNTNKDSYKVMLYLQKNGYKTLPVNPYAAKEKILGEKVYKNLSEIDMDIDILNIFRPSHEILDITKEIINSNIKTVWLQVDIFDLNAEKILKKSNISFFQNMCMKKEHYKLFKYV